ncbi:methyltransferase domain-containing protein [Lysobacter sp. FW306-1B-D06B]|nr:class I SAM-dependent methyltransferase [Lysobacter sp. MMG2]
MRAAAYHCSAHMDEADLEATRPDCPICGSRNRRSVLPLQESPDVALMHCLDCEATSASRMPRPDVLDRYYAGYYDNGEEGVTFDRPTRFARHVYRHGGPHLGALEGRALRMVDFGGGDGTHSALIARELLAHGASSVRIELVDHSPSTADPGDARIQFERVADVERIAPGMADIVLASAVLEHIPEPRPVLLHLLSAMKPGGIFYARTPHVVPLMKLARTLGTSLDFTYPGHVHDMGARFWDGALDRLGMAHDYRILRSAPSIVETTIDRHFARTVLAYALKWPGRLFPHHYGLVGGWEVFLRREH